MGQLWKKMLGKWLWDSESCAGRRKWSGIGCYYLHDYRLVYQARSLSRLWKLVVGKQVPNFRKVELDRLDLGHETVRLSHKVGCRAETPLFGVLSRGDRGWFCTAEPARKEGGVRIMSRNYNMTTTWLPHDLSRDIWWGQQGIAWSLSWEDASTMTCVSWCPGVCMRLMTLLFHLEEINGLGLSAW